MSHIAKRLVSAAASALVLTVLSTAAQAQTDVLTFTGTKTANDPAGAKVMNAVYTFNTSMILNSIGFYETGPNFGDYYEINGAPIFPSTGISTKDSNNVFWVTLDRLMNAGDVLEVITVDTEYLGATANSGTNVSYGGMGYGNPPTGLPTGISTSRTNSNIRVTNPSSNVAPEPGTFALALTGGGALLGICIRRRRNAA
jgi:hypothetical protein